MNYDAYHFGHIPYLVPLDIPHVWSLWTYTIFCSFGHTPFLVPVDIPHVCSLWTYPMFGPFGHTPCLVPVDIPHVWSGQTGVSVHQVYPVRTNVEAMSEPVSG